MYLQAYTYTYSKGHHEQPRLLAIIMDAYQVEKFKASDTTTLWQQVLDMIQRRRQYQRSERVRLTDIFEVFRKQYKGKEKEMMSSDRMISVEYLVTHVTRMPYRQAYKTLVNALKRDEELLGHASAHCIASLVIFSKWLSLIFHKDIYVYLFFIYVKI